MEITIYQQTSAFLYSFVLGAIIFLLYIALTIIRIMIPPGRLGLFAGDILFMAAVTVLNFLFSLSQTSGNIRAYSVLAQIISFTVLYLTVGRLIKRFSDMIYSFLVSAYHFVYDPVMKVYGRCTTAFRIRLKNILQSAKKIKKW